MYSSGLAALLQESATVAWDTTKLAYVNPQTGASYGADPPAGFWRVGPTNVATGYDPAYCTQTDQPGYGCPAGGPSHAAAQAAIVAGTYVEPGSGAVVTTTVPVAPSVNQSNQQATTTGGAGGTTASNQNVNTGTATGGGTSTNATATDPMTAISSFISGNLGLVIGIGAILLLMTMGGGEEHHRYA